MTPVIGADAISEPAGQVGYTRRSRGGEQLVAEEESAAAAEAARIGAVAPRDAADPALEPVHEAGGGAQDRWDAAERGDPNSTPIAGRAA